MLALSTELEDSAHLVLYLLITDRGSDTPHDQAVATAELFWMRGR